MSDSAVLEACTSLQTRVLPWIIECLGLEVASDRRERNHRFIEEALETVQACGGTREECHRLVDYVFSRPVGEPDQEVGGVMITLAALCLANGLDMHAAGDREMERISAPEVIEKIRRKQVAKREIHAPRPALPMAELVAEARAYAADILDVIQRRAAVISIVWGEAHKRGHELTFAEVERAVEEQSR